LGILFSPELIEVIITKLLAQSSGEVVESNIQPMVGKVTSAVNGGINDVALVVMQVDGGVVNDCHFGLGLRVEKNM
jgi:hypothetical protein